MFMLLPLIPQVEEIVAKTLIAVEPAMLSASQRAGPPRATNCFELFGFDVLLDAQRRAWLLEVNTTPALNTDSPLDMVGGLGPCSSTLFADFCCICADCISPLPTHIHQQRSASIQSA
jgi:hypothetical protein